MKRRWLIAGYALGLLVAWPTFWTIFMAFMPEMTGANKGADIGPRVLVTTLYSVVWPISLPLSLIGYIGYSVMAES